MSKIAQIKETFQISPSDINRNLFKKFASSQSYYYSNIISQISKEKRTSANITYQDVQYMCDQQEYLKRFYGDHQYNSKLFSFKEYYFYHHDCPRIFMKAIEQMYSKWHDRKRDLVYKRLKILYNESFSSQKSSSKQEDKKSATGITHFLLEISDYNPFSKKYYLRVQAKRQKEQKQKKLQNANNRTKNDISSLNHQLSIMLTDMSQLSIISTLQEHDSPRTLTLYHSKKPKVNYSSQYSTHNTQNNSNSNSRIKFNFKKEKHQREKMSSNLIVNDQITRKLSFKQKSQQKFQILPKASPKYTQNKISDVFKKSNSVFKLSQFNSNKKSDLQIVNSNKKQPLKLTVQTKKNPITKNRVTIENQAVKRYDSQKKTIISKSQSTKKVNKIDFKSIQKRSSFSNIRKFSVVKQSETPENKILNKGPLFTNEFSDSKMVNVNIQNPNNQDVRFRSHKSQYNSTNSKFSTIGSQINQTNQITKRNLFKIKDFKDAAFKMSVVGNGKKALQLKLH